MMYNKDWEATGICLKFLKYTAIFHISLTSSFKKLFTETKRKFNSKMKSKVRNKTINWYF